MSLQKKSFYLSHGVKNYANYDQHAGPAEKSSDIVGYTCSVENEIWENSDDG